MKDTIKYVAWSDEEKAKMFDEIAEKFYYANFGQLAKADMELMMFNFYLNKLIEQNQNDNGTIDYNKCSDYLISKELGITQQRVRNLKVKKQLIYPIEFTWQDSLKKLEDNIRYDETKDRIIIPTPDPNLYNEIQNFIVSKGGYIDIQFSNNTIQIRPEYFWVLLYEGIADEKEKAQLRKEISTKLKENNSDKNKLQDTDEELTDFVLSTANDTFGTILEILEVIPTSVSGLVKIFTSIKGINKLYRKYLKKKQS